MKFPWESVLVSLRIRLAPSLTRETSAPESGFPLVSLTEPVIVASAVLFVVAARDSCANNVANATRDNPTPNALLIAKRPPGAIPNGSVLKLGSTTQRFLAKL